MRLLRRHQAAVFLVLLVAATWGALWLAYDYRSPFNQWVSGLGTVQIDGWTASELNSVCVRLEPVNIVPPAKADSAIQVAGKTYPGAYVHEVVLVSFHDTCSGASARLVWAVAMDWAGSAAAALPTGASPPRAIVLVDAATGTLLANHDVGLHVGATP